MQNEVYLWGLFIVKFKKFIISILFRNGFKGAEKIVNDIVSQWLRNILYALYIKKNTN